MEYLSLLFAEVESWRLSVAPAGTLKHSFDKPFSHVSMLAYAGCREESPVQAKYLLSEFDLFEGSQG